MKRTSVGSLAKLLGIAFVLLWVGIPFFSLVSVSLAPEGAPAAALAWPQPVSWEHYGRVLTGVESLWLYLKNSVIVSLLATLAALALGLPCAYGLSRLQRYAAARALYLAVFVLRMLPPITLVIPYFILIGKLRLLDTKIGLIYALLAPTLPLAIWTAKTFFDAVPTALDEAARIDGATGVQIFTRVALPLIGSGIAVTAILTFLTAYVDYIFAITLTNHDALTLPAYIAGFKAEYRFYVGDMLAATLIGTLPMIGLFLVVQRHMRRVVLAGVH
jgi:ABC-type glycerol-3-phosphate transport system permease component